MNQGALAVGVVVGGLTFAVGLAQPPAEAVAVPDNCRPVRGYQAAGMVCYETAWTSSAETATPTGGVSERALSPAFAAAVRAAATMRRPLPTWLPAGVLRWEAEIHAAADEAGLDPLALAILVSIECPSGNPNCDSSNPPAFPDGAVGLSQFMRTTANAVAERSGIPCWNRTDPVVSLRCGAYHFVELLSMCGDVWQTGREAPAIACAGAGYNAGPGYIPAMVRHIQAGGSLRAAPVPGQTQDWIDMALDRWAQGGRQ